MASGHLVSYLRQNVRVDRAAANQATTPKPADPRLRVQRFVRALDEHEKEVRAAALSVIIRRSLDNSFRESSCCRYVFVIQARTHRASSPWHTPHQSTACQWSMSFVFSESHRSADHQSPFRDLLSAAVSQTIIRNVSMPQRSRAACEPRTMLCCVTNNKREWRAFSEQTIRMHAKTNSRRAVAFGTTTYNTERLASKPVQTEIII